METSFAITPVIKNSSPILMVYNRRMLELLAEAPGKGIATTKDWCKRIGVQQTHIRDLRAGSRSFSVEQMVNAVKLHETTMDWVCGLTDNRAHPEKHLTGLQMLEAGLSMIKEQLANQPSGATQKNG